MLGCDGDRTLVEELAARDDAVEERLALLTAGGTGGHPPLPALAAARLLFLNSAALLVLPALAARGGHASLLLRGKLSKHTCKHIIEPRLWSTLRALRLALTPS